MMGQQPRTDSLFYYFRLEDQIPEDHLLRLIDHHAFPFSQPDNLAPDGPRLCPRQFLKSRR